MDKDISVLINNIEVNMHESILELDHKLKILREEIEAKLHDATEDHLSVLIKEVNQAIYAITDVVNLSAK